MGRPGGTNRHLAQRVANEFSTATLTISGDCEPVSSPNPKNSDVFFEFTVTDDDPASSGSCVNYVVPGQVGTKQGCAYWQGSKWRGDLHTGNGGTGTISWTYKDKFGAAVNGSFTATVQ